MHIKRLKRELNNVGVKCTVYDIGGTSFKGGSILPVYRSRNWFLTYYLRSSIESIIHYHGSSWKFRAFLALLLKLRSAKSVYTIHSLRDNFEDLDLWTKLFVKFTLRFGDHFIVVAPHIHDKLLDWGATSEKLTIVPGFIPPRIEQRDLNNTPDYLKKFMIKHAPIITANAFRISFFQGEDLYGIDMCIGLCASLREESPNIGFVFFLPEIGDEKYFEKLTNQIIEEDLIDNFLFVNEQIEYYPVLAKADLFIRPTNTDGDAVSIREALSFGTRVVCSDVVSRPNGVTLFRSRDLCDLIEKSRQSLDLTISNQGHLRNRLVDNSSQSTNAQTILRLYQVLLGTKSTHFLEVDGIK